MSFEYISAEETGLGFGIIDGVSISKGTPDDWKADNNFIEYPYDFYAHRFKNKKVRELGKKLIKQAKLLAPAHFYTKEYYSSTGKNISLKYQPHTRYRNMVKAINLGVS